MPALPQAGLVGLFPVPSIDSTADDVDDVEVDVSVDRRLRPSRRLTWGRYFTRASRENRWARRLMVFLYFSGCWMQHDVRGLSGCGRHPGMGPHLRRGMG